MYAQTQAKTEIKLIDRGSVIPATLYDLLALSVPYGYEYLLYPILRRVFDHTNAKVVKDKIGNIFATIGDNPSIMFSCHLDTVHRVTSNKLAMVLPCHLPNDMVGGSVYVKNFGLLRSPLGADDKIGVYILLRMMRAKIRGLYAFHVGEEVGCVGSKYAAENNKELFKGIKACIAFDRMNYGDIISQQRGGDTASKEFTNALAVQLNGFLPPHCTQKFKGGVQGVYTDSAEYKRIIPECTNVSVGYFEQHGSSEHFDPIWLQNLLLPALIKTDWSSLPITRDPTKVIEISYGYTGGYRHHGSYNVVPFYKNNAMDKLASAEEKLALDEVTIQTPLKNIPEWSPGKPLPSKWTSPILSRFILAYITNNLASRNVYALSKISSELATWVMNLVPNETPEKIGDSKSILKHMVCISNCINILKNTPLYAANKQSIERIETEYQVLAELMITSDDKASVSDKIYSLATRIHVLNLSLKDKRIKKQLAKLGGL